MKKHRISDLVVISKPSSALVWGYANIDIFSLCHAYQQSNCMKIQFVEDRISRLLLHFLIQTLNLPLKTGPVKKYCRQHYIFMQIHHDYFKTY